MSVLETKLSSLISWIIFLSTLVIVIISLTSAVFPTLLLRGLGGFEDRLGINPFEPGIWAGPLLLTNFIVFGLLVLYFKNKLPLKLKKSINFIFNFEVSKNVAFLVVVVLLGIYISFSAQELVSGYFEPDYERIHQMWLDIYTPFDYTYWGLGKHFGLFLLYASMEIFGNHKVIPFIISIALLIVTYLLTAKISQKRFGGIVSMVVLMQSVIFLWFDTSVSHPNFWVFFYILALYLIYLKPPLSPFSYIASLLSKSMAAGFFPIIFLFILRTNLTKKRKIKSLIFYGILALVGAIVLGSGITFEVAYEAVEFSSHDFWAGFNALHSSLRYDGLILLFLLPLTIGLFLASRKGILQADSILFLILGMLLSAPFIGGFSDIINPPYRFVPLVVFFAIGVGILLSKRVSQQSE